MKLLFDSTVLIDALRGRRKAIDLIEQAAGIGAQCFTSAINVAEVYSGMRVGEEEQVETLVSAFLCLPVTKEISRHAGELRPGWARRGRTFGLADMIVAATAIQHEMLIVTANQKDFEVAELAIWPQ